MSHELFYTSAPKGLRPGSRGFCTVASTEGLPAHLAEQIESLSAYRPLFPPLDARGKLNPIVYSHLRLTAGSKTYHVLSRIGPAGLDYSQRSNKFAHHVILEPGELPAGGPAWLLAQPGFLEDQWNGEVRYLPAGRIPPQGDAAPSVCRHWKNLTGDAGWAGVLADSFEKDPLRQVYLIFSPGTDVLPLVVESLKLLSPAKRWPVTFSTYFTNLPQGIPCLWRFVAKGSPEANASRLPGALVLNLTEPLGKPPESELVEMARTGQSRTLDAAEDNGSKEWLKYFQPVTQPRTIPSAGKNQPAQTDERSRARPNLPSGNAIDGPTRRKGLWFGAAFIGLILGFASGFCASSLISKSKEELTNQAIEKLNEEKQTAESEQQQFKRELLGLTKQKSTADSEKQKSFQRIEKLEEDMWNAEQSYYSVKKELNDRGPSALPAPPKAKELKKEGPSRADKPFTLPPWNSNPEQKPKSFPISEWNLHQNGKFTLKLRGPLKADGAENSTLNIGHGLATFAIDKASVSFRWTGKPIPDVIKKELPECILEIKDDKQSETRRIPLRSPITKTKDSRELEFSLVQGGLYDIISTDEGSVSLPLRFQRIAFLLEGKLFHWEANESNLLYPIITVFPIELGDRKLPNGRIAKGTTGGILFKKSLKGDHLVSLMFVPTENRNNALSEINIRPEIRILTIVACMNVDGTYVEVIKIDWLSELVFRAALVS